LNDIFRDQAVIYIHHTHKLSPPPGQKIQHKISPVDSVRGSSFFSGEVDAVYLLYGKYLSTDCRFDESTDYHVERDEITKLWTFPDTEKISKQEAKIRELWASKTWTSWREFREYITHILVTVPDHLLARLEGELQSSAPSP